MPSATAEGGTVGSPLEQALLLDVVFLVVIRLRSRSFREFPYLGGHSGHRLARSVRWRVSLLSSLRPGRRHREALLAAACDEGPTHDSPVSRETAAAAHRRLSLAY